VSQKRCEHKWAQRWCPLKCHQCGSKGCEFPWTQLGKNNLCYAVSTGALNYYGADQFCKTQGGYLAEPRTQEETENLELFLLREQNYWIGLTDAADEGTFVWGTDYSSPTYTNWAMYQPDNGMGRGDDCVILSMIFGLKWHDLNCIKTNSDGADIHAVCQKSP